MSIASNFPAIKPTLLLDFANTEQLDPRITFTRASTATYYGTQTAKAEENLLAFSQDFNETTWGKTDASVGANTVAAPDGTTTADTITFTSAGGNQRVTATSPTLVSQNYVFSVFLKGTAGQTVTIEFDATASAVTLTASWARYTVSGSATTTSSVVRIISRTGNTATVFDIWGAQLEQRSAVSAYTATTTQPITNYIPVLQTAASGVARFDHNPTTGESLGLLIEESRTNLLTYSEQFDNAAWTKAQSSITANTIVSPAGTLTGDKLVEDTASNVFHVISQYAVASGAAGVSYTLSVYAKPAGRTKFVMQIDGGGFGTGNGVFDVANGTAGSAAGTASSPKITSIGNGWYRCSLVVTSSGSFTGVGLKIITVNASDAQQYTGDGYSGIYIWGAQLEAGAFATSYTPTVASQVTRAADAASMTGTNFSSWYNQAEGTFYAAVSVIDAETPTSQVFLEARSDATNLLGMYVQVGDGFLANNCIVGGVVQAQLGLVDLPNTPASFANAFAYKVNDFAGVYNGAAAVTDASGTVPANTALYIGNRGDLARPLNGTISKIAYYPIRVSNTNLQALTS